MSLFKQWIFINLILIIWYSFPNVVNAIKESARSNDDAADCMSILMASKYLKDDQFSASSYLPNNPLYVPSAARMEDVHSQTDSNSQSSGRAWCIHQGFQNMSEWIQVDFQRMAIIKSIYTMGRGEFPQFTSKILIMYQRSDSSVWITYKNNRNESVLSINTDARTKLRSTLTTIVARKIKIFPLKTSASSVGVCLRFALLGCLFKDEVINYTAPQGDIVTIGNQLVDLTDHDYDGQKFSVLTNGLGLLMDNFVWRKKFDIDEVIKYGQLKMFQGWSCDGTQKRSFIIIEFKFNEERNFTSLILYSVKDSKYNIYPPGPIMISIGQNKNYSKVYMNQSSFEENLDFHAVQIAIPLQHYKGDVCIINITCILNNIILLSEIEIKSTKSIRNSVSNSSPKQPTIHYVNSSDWSRVTSELPDYQLRNPSLRQQDITAIVLVILIVLLFLFVLGMAFMCYMFQRSRRNKLKKKLELVAQGNSQSMCSQTPGTVYTIPSKTPAISTFQQPKYFSEMKTSHSAVYSGSQPSDGVYASWPNTDEDADVATIDKEEEKCLLSAEVGERSSLKEYATYQCGVNQSPANDYILSDGNTYKFHGQTRPSSIVTTLPNISTLSVPLLKIVNSYETPKSTPVVTYRSNKKLVPPNLDSIPYHHLLNYRGACGDINFWYQQSHIRVDQSNLESNITVIPISSLIPKHHLILGDYGSVSLCEILTDADTQATSHFFVKNINPDSQPAIKTSFIMDFKVLSSISSPNIAKLEAIAIENDMVSSDLVNIIKSTRFYILIEFLSGCNLKEFLRNTYYSKISQELKSSQQVFYSQISMSHLLAIIAQISNGMKHLEELGLIHRDLACRNCMIDLRMHVKIYPGGLVTMPNEDYCSMEVLNHIVTFPLRWMAPESIMKGIFTNKSDVWSFAVTLWEIFTLCSSVPYGSLTNEALLDLMSQRNNTPRLPCPQNCTKEIYDVMLQCWNLDDSSRPKFVDIQKFFQFKISNSASQAQIFLPAPPPDEPCS